MIGDMADWVRSTHSSRCNSDAGAWFSTWGSRVGRGTVTTSPDVGRDHPSLRRVLDDRRHGDPNGETE